MKPRGFAKTLQHHRPFAVRSLAGTERSAVNRVGQFFGRWCDRFTVEGFPAADDRDFFRLSGFGDVHVELVHHAGIEPMLRKTEAERAVAGLQATGGKDGAIPCSLGRGSEEGPRAGKVPLPGRPPGEDR